MLQTAFFCQGSTDRGSVFSVLWYIEIQIREKCFDHAANCLALREIRQRTDQDEILHIRALRDQCRCLTDRFNDHVHDSCRLIFAACSGGCFAEIGSRHFQIQPRQWFLGDIADAQIDVSDLSAQRKLLDLVNVRCIQHQLGKPDDRAAADADAAQVRWDAVLDPDKGSAGSHADDHKLLLTLREIAAADAIGCKLINPVGRQSGGDLSRAMNRAASIIGDKIQLEAELKALMAQKAFESRIVAGAPFAMVLLMRVTAPSYMRVMYETSSGLVITSISLLLIACAFWLMERINQIEI